MILFLVTFFLLYLRFLLYAFKINIETQSFVIKNNIHFNNKKQKVNTGMLWVTVLYL